MRITTAFHPRYRACYDDYVKWRLTATGGRPFIHEYLIKFDAREDQTDFEKRRRATYCPALAKEGLVEINSGIYQRAGEISRRGGTRSYQTSIQGDEGGVDLMGTDMNTFMVKRVLWEMTSMGLCGVMVDMPQFNPNATLAEFQRVPRPYLYYYRAEDIVNWAYVYRENELRYTQLLLRETRFTTDPVYGMVVGEEEIFRYMRLTDEGVQVQFWKPNPLVDTKTGQDTLIEEYLIPMNRIPFVPFDIGQSLLFDVADMQATLTNLSSADVNWVYKAGFPFYVEPYDPKTEDLYLKKGPVTNLVANPLAGQPHEPARVAMEQAPPTTGRSDPADVVVGVTRGRRYPMGADAPSFIHPSSDPLMASMAKQDQIERHIRQQLNLGVANVAPSRASAESKRVDQVGLESGLARMGLELESGERQIAEIWSLYEESNQVAVISYPTTYSLKSDQDRIGEAKEQKELKTAVPSKRFQKHMSKRIADCMFEGRLPNEELDAIHKEIDAANYITSDPVEIASDIALGLVGAETASDARGYDGKTEVPIAQAEQLKRIEQVAISQAKGGGAGANAARGTPVGAGDTSAKDEKSISQNPLTSTNPGQKKTRGKGNKP